MQQHWARHTSTFSINPSVVCQLLSSETLIPTDNEPGRSEDCRTVMPTASRRMSLDGSVLLVRLFGHAKIDEERCGGDVNKPGAFYFPALLP